MARNLRILFVGESWQGSCARSTREALARQPQVQVDDLSEDLYPPPSRTRSLRIANRLLSRAYRKELARVLDHKIEILKPDFVVTYKGAHIDAPMVQNARSAGPKFVNIYPDASPHAYGPRHREAVAAYDGVISTKPFHPKQWHSVYGYTNLCEFVPQGYDPLLHLQADVPKDFKADVAMVATWRREYHELLLRFATAIDGKLLRVAIAGNGWHERRAEFPTSWVFANELQGRSYIEWLRSAKVCFAPVTTEVVIDGKRQPGDVDSTRTYELAAAHCFFIHRRTPYVESIYDEQTEAPMFSSAEELAEKTVFYLNHDALREAMARNAHKRAVPAYSSDARAAAIIAILQRWRQPGSKPRAA